VVGRIWGRRGFGQGEPRDSRAGSIMKRQSEGAGPLTP
jgi:hypothetical protein